MAIAWKPKKPTPLRLLFSGLVAAYLALLVWPDIAFAYHYDYRQVRVSSDRPIDPAIEIRLDEALALVARSELYDPAQSFNIYLCNDNRRLALFTRNPKVGGLVQGIISENIFIREADISANKVIPYDGTMMDMENRPLTYYFAHEMTHAMQARQSRFLAITTSSDVIEGYADYIGKGPDFDFDEAVDRLKSGHEFFDPETKLYARQHLYMAELIDRRGQTFKEILSGRPDMNAVLKQLQK